MSKKLIEISFYNTLPDKEDGFWQIDLLPVIGVLRHKIEDDYTEGYLCIALQWLFWSMSITINRRLI